MSSIRFTRKAWISCNNAQSMIDSAQDLSIDARIIARVKVNIAKIAENRMKDARSIKALKVAGDFADGKTNIPCLNFHSKNAFNAFSHEHCYAAYSAYAASSIGSGSLAQYGLVDSVIRIHYKRSSVLGAAICLISMLPLAFTSAIVFANESLLLGSALSALSLIFSYRSYSFFTFESKLAKIVRKSIPFEIIEKAQSDIKKR